MRVLYNLLMVFLLGSCLAVGLSSCTDDESFSQSTADRLYFPSDTLRLDTVFSTYSSSTKTFWVYNLGKEGLRLTTVRLKSGGSSGFRVNVDGSFLDHTQGAVVRDLEVRHGDSIRVFVEVTPAATGSLEPLAFSDDLVFTLESGLQQTVRLEAWAWDAITLRNVVVSSDSVIESQKPVIVYGGITVDSAATLTVRSTTLFFHDQAGMDVYGQLICEGTDSLPVVLRGDRLDRMFSYLPYHRVSGQWRGLRFFPSSTGNRMDCTHVLNACDAVVVDSAGVDSLQTRLTMRHCMVHNAKGAGVAATGAHIVLDYCQLTNTLGPCLSVTGGWADVSQCTLAQFYPFSADRGAALLIANLRPDDGADLPLQHFLCTGSIVTGYESDVLSGILSPDTTVAFTYQFDHCLLRTPQVETADSLYYTSVLWETPKDSVQGRQHFRIIDEDLLYYDFRLDSLSTAHGLGCYPE